jgi:membrane protein
MTGVGEWMARGGRALSRARERWGPLDHLIRAFSRYQADGGDRLAAGVTYYAFLAFFPMLLLVVSGIGYLLEGDPALERRAIARLNEYLPGLYRTIEKNIEAVTDNRRGIGLFAVVALIWAGLTWLDSLRESLRIMWHHDVRVGSFARKKLIDLATIVGLGLTLGVSLAVTGLVGASAGWVLAQVGLSGRSNAAVAATTVLGLVVGAAADTALFLFLFKQLPKLDWPFRRLVAGAVFGAMGFGLLKIVGKVYIARVVANSTASMGTLAVVAGLLVWMNLVSRLTLYAAAWTVTQPYVDDSAPSGTSSPEAAAAAGLSPAQAAAMKLPDVPTSSVVNR